MRHIEVQDDLADGFELAPLPPPGPDGGLDLPPMRPPRRDPPSLCTAGPCKRYHRFVTQLDAQAPVRLTAKRAAELRVVQDAARGFHPEIHHYCYPTDGVETNLGATPVLECTLYEPVSRMEEMRIEASRRNFLSTDAGQAYTASLAAWRAELDADRAADRAAADAAAAQAAIDLANMPTAVPDPEPEAGSPSTTDLEPTP